MFETDVAYYRERAEIETMRAKTADTPEVVRIHRQLAEAYRDRLAAVRPEPIDAR